MFLSILIKISEMENPILSDFESTSDDDEDWINLNPRDGASRNEQEIAWETQEGILTKRMTKDDR